MKVKAGRVQVRVHFLGIVKGGQLPIPGILLLAGNIAVLDLFQILILVIVHIVSVSVSYTFISGSMSFRRNLGECVLNACARARVVAEAGLEARETFIDLIFVYLVFSERGFFPLGIKSASFIVRFFA